MIGRVYPCTSRTYESHLLQCSDCELVTSDNGILGMLCIKVLPATSHKASHSLIVSFPIPSLPNCQNSRPGRSRPFSAKTWSLSRRLNDFSSFVHWLGRAGAIAKVDHRAVCLGYPAVERCRPAESTRNTTVVAIGPACNR